MEERKRNHLTLEIKNHIVLEKVRKPRRTVRDLIFDVNLKYGIKTSIRAIHRVLKFKEEILENTKDATKFGLQRKRLISKERTDFESLLDSKLRENFLKKMLTQTPSHSNFWFVPYTGGDNFPKNDDLFPIRAFPIREEDCIVHRPLFCDFKISKMAQNKGRLAQTREISRISDKIIDLLILMRYFCTIFGFRNNLFKIRVYRLKKDLNFSFLSKISSHFGLNFRRTPEKPKIRRK